MRWFLLFVYWRIYRIIKRGPVDRSSRRKLRPKMRLVRDGRWQFTTEISCLPKVDLSFFARITTLPSGWMCERQTASRFDRSTCTRKPVTPEHFSIWSLQSSGYGGTASPLFTETLGEGEKRGRRNTTKPDGRINLDDFRGPPCPSWRVLGTVVLASTATAGRFVSSGRVFATMPRT